MDDPSGLAALEMLARSMLSSIVAKYFNFPHVCVTKSRGSGLSTVKKRLLPGGVDSVEVLNVTKLLTFGRGPISIFFQICLKKIYE